MILTGDPTDREVQEALRTGIAATVGEATEVPRRSPGRGPPYWKSCVLRLKVLGGEDGSEGRGL